MAARSIEFVTCVLSHSHMTNPSRIQLVCFDLGGVLVRICGSWQEACQAAGLAVRGPWKNGDPPTDEQRQLGVLFGTGRIDPLTWAQRLSRTVNGLYTPEEILAAHDCFLIQEYEGVADVIERVHKAGLRTAALSNTNEKHWQALTKYPAIQKLHHPFASHLLGFHKPDPAIYREFEKRTNRRGAEILFFDDLPENIESARQIGWNVELIDPCSPTDVQIEQALLSRGLIERAR